MKENSNKILLWLYSDNLQKPLVSNYEELSTIVPELTRGGLRSVIRHLNQQQLIRADVLEQQALISLTRHGHDKLRRVFPALFSSDETWQKEWNCLVFLTSPARDPGFRYLRTVLLDSSAVQLSRGVYVYPGEFPEKILSLCQELYVGAVTIFTIGSWQFGDERSVMIDNFSLSDVVELYSGVSNDINRLLQLKQAKKSTDSSFKAEFSSAFNRLYTTLYHDTGLARYFFPSLIHPAQLVHHFHQLVSK